MSETIDTLLHEDRSFPPSPEFTAQANLGDAAIYDQADRDPEGWWVSWAEKLDWFEPWNQVMEWNRP
ncbi:MAG: acetyl-coenzyme A synthetase, partial [Armatimonadetes bacterium]|nr:acetyl-coenzyme A synthetase [Armatimonadota bacterium]